jgi:hypothetical protein
MTYEQFIQLNPEGDIYNIGYTNYLTAKLNQINNYLNSKMDKDEILEFESYSIEILDIIGKCLNHYVDELELIEDTTISDMIPSHL